MDATQALSPLLQVQILGPIVVLLMLACGWLVRALIDSYEKRNTDAKKFSDSAAVLAAALNENTNSINSVLKYHEELLRIIGRQNGGES